MSDGDAKNRRMEVMIAASKVSEDMSERHEPRPFVSRPPYAVSPLLTTPSGSVRRTRREEWPEDGGRREAYGGRRFGLYALLTSSHSLRSLRNE